VSEHHVDHRGGQTRIIVDPGASSDLASYAALAAPDHRPVAIIDANVARLYPDLLPSVARLIVPAGEAHKSRDSWAALTDHLLEMECDRQTLIIAIGGGVTTDLAGFVAATFLRGVPWIAVPTTTLGMCDAAIGGKTGVDTASGKNLVGAFHQPRAVIADPNFLATLPDAVYRDGLAESVKHAAIFDEDDFAWLDAQVDAILARDPEVLAELVAASCQIKATMVTEDEHESGIRAILNAGHTIGHALEHASDYLIGHGQAVAFGLIEEAVIGESMGVTATGTAEALGTLLAKFGFDTTMPPSVDESRYRAALRSDKKNRNGKVRAVLLRRIGAVARQQDGSWTWEIVAR
jgi:3-dehydroquinate synthase